MSGDYRLEVAAAITLDERMTIFDGREDASFRRAMAGHDTADSLEPAHLVHEYQAAA